MDSTIKLLVSDMILSLMWVCSTVLVNTLVDAKGEAFKCGISLLNMFFFAWLSKLTKVAAYNPITVLSSDYYPAYNPLTVLSSVFSGDFSTSLFTVGARILSQEMGWAYARGDYKTKEHIFVYWLAPIEATVLAAWMFSLILQSQKEEKAKVKAGKSD